MMWLEQYRSRTIQVKVMIAGHQHLFDTRDFTNVCGYA